MKFLADMGISPKTVEFLRRVGHEAAHLHELGLDKLSDFEILSKARREGSCVLTSDLDFSELVAVGGHQLPSVIVFRLRDMRPDSVNQHLKAILDQYIGALEEGATEADLLDAYPRLTKQDIQAALAYAASTLAHETIMVQAG